MSQHSNVSTGERSGALAGEPSVSLSRADLALLLTAERRLSLAQSRPAEVLRFFLLAVEETAALLRVDRALLCLIDADDPQRLRVMAGTGAMADEEGEILPVEGSFEGRVFMSVEPLRTNDLSSEPDLYRPRQNQRRAGPALGVPLRLRNRPVGVLLVAREPHSVGFLDRDAELLREFATPITAAIEAMRQFDSVRRSREAVESWDREQQLRKWLSRYEALAAARVELVFRMDRSGSMEWGASTEAIFGIAPDHFAPRLETLLARVVPEDVEPVRSSLRALSAPDGPLSISLPCGIFVDSEQVHAKRLKAWRSGDQGEIIGLLTPASRATRGVEDEVETMEPKGEAIVRSLRHQINNPLAAVIGRAQLLLREEAIQREPGLRQSVETILYEGERIGRFVQELQNFDGLQRLTEPLPGDAPARR